MIEFGSSQFLVYGLIDPRNNDLRYVGKSARGMKRPKEHLSPSGRKGETHKARWLRQIYSDERRLPIILIIRECKSELDAFEHEIAVISIFNKAGFNLTNLSNGGEGAGIGHLVREDTKKKIAERTRFRMQSKEARDHLRELQLGKKETEESVEKNRRAQKGKILSESHKTNIRNAMKSVVVADKIRMARIGRKVSDETKEKMRLSQTGRKHTEESKLKMRLARIGRKCNKATCETKAKMRSSRIRAWQRGVYK